MSKCAMDDLLNDEQMSNKVGVEHQPDRIHKNQRNVDNLFKSYGKFGGPKTRKNYALF